MARIRLLWWLKFDLLERPAATSLQPPLQCKIQKMKQLLWTANPILVALVCIIIEIFIGFVLIYSLFQGNLR